MQLLLSYVATLIPLLVLDMLWILVVAKSFYATHMANIFSKTFNLGPVFFFYPLYAVGVLLLAVLPAVSAGSWIEALWRGAILGLAAYGAYDLTNQATIAGWPTSMTLLDMSWGVVLTATTSVIAYAVIAALK